MISLPSPVFDGVIDASHWNGLIDWPAVAGAGIALAFIKASEGIAETDSSFDKNRSAALAAGLLVVPYHFLDLEDPVAQARNFLAIAELTRGDPAMIDWETPCPSSNLVAVGALVTQATGRDPVGYYGCSQLVVADATLSNWPLMLPEYPRGSAPGDYRSLVTAPPRVPPGRSVPRPYDFHQYTPSGRVPGVSGPVDRSVWVGTSDQLRRWHGGG